MSADIEAVCSSATPPDIDAARASCGALGLEFAVIRQWSDWSNYELKKSGPVLDEDIFVLWLKDGAASAKIVAALNQRDHDAVAHAFHKNWAGAVQCDRSKRRIHLVPFAGNGTLNTYGAGALAQSFVIQHGGHYELDGERFNVENNQIDPFPPYETVKESTETGSTEELFLRLQAESLAWHERIDAHLTEERCPQCKKPMLTYRKSCRFCGFVRGRQ